MKKFTFMLLAAFIAVATWAQPVALKNHQVLPEQFAAKTATTLKQVAPEKKEMAPRQALKGQVQFPAQKRQAKKAGVKKAFDLTALLSGEPIEFMVKSLVFDVENQGTEEEPNYQLVPVEPNRTSEFWTMTVDAATMTASITGINGGDSVVIGTFDVTAKTITIPYGQIVDTTNYGTIALASATGAENLVGQLNGDAIEFNDLWYTQLIDGSYAGEAWSYYYSSEAVLPNGKMAWVDSNGTDTEVAVDIDFDEATSTATVWNFGDFEVAIDVTLKNGGKFVIEQQLVFTSSSYGNYLTWGITAGDYPKTISGTGTETELTFGSDWTVMNEGMTRWYGQQGAATITFDGKFVYPVLTEAPATPATPSVTFFQHWDGTNAVATVNVPCVDVDGNDIISSLLTYQLFTIDELGAPVALGEPIAYDNAVNGTDEVKTVTLGEEAKGLTVIGVKSIYTALGETNESALSEWFEIPQLVEVPAGLELKEYPVSADAYNGSGWVTYTGAAQVGIDGTDIYVQGILPHCPEGWVKGTLEGNVATFPVQFVGLYNGSVYLYLAAYDSNTKGLKEATFTYNADEDFYVSEDILFANSNTEKLGFYYPYFDGMMIGTETIPELVELPEGAEVVEYPFVGTTYSSDGSAEFGSTVNVAVVGDDVYVQGLNEYVPEAWVKGTKDAETGNFVFPTGQNLGVYEGSSSSYQFFMVGYDANTQELADVVMTYNEKQDFYELQNDLLVNGKKTSLNYYKWYEAGSTIGIQTEFTATFNFNAMDVPVSTNTTTDGDITETEELTESIVSLAISPKDENVSKTENRYWSTKNGPQLRVYSGTLTFSVPEGNNITEIVFNNGKWNDGNKADSGEFEGATWTGNAQTVVVTIAGNTQINSIDVTYAVKQLPPMIETEAPDDLETADWSLEATEVVYYEEEVDDETGEVISEERYENEAYTAITQVGFYTVAGEEGTEVYIQGLCPELPEAWVKGTLADGKVTIPASTFFGVYTYIDWDAYAYVDENLFLTAAEINADNTVTLKDVEFVYDAEANKLTSTQTIFVNADRRDVNYYHWYQGMVLTLVPDVAATPADPEFTGFKVANTNYPRVDFTIPTVSVDGNALLTSKLSYQFFIVKEDGDPTPLVLTTDLYEELAEDMTVIPYDFCDYWDVYNDHLYLNQSEEELYSWDKLGLQSIYTGGGETNKSNIVWFDVRAYWVATGIANVNVDNKNVVIFDLQGRRVAQPAKGLYIVNGKKVVIK